MRIRLVLFVFLVFALVIGVFSQAGFDSSKHVRVDLIDINGRGFFDAQVKTVLIDEGFNMLESRSGFLDKEGGFNYLFNSDGYALFVYLDYFNTSGVDYFGLLEGFNGYLGQRALVVMSPSGSLRGYVYDERENLVSGVLVKLDCFRISNKEHYFSSDKYGSFFIEGVPSKDCRVWAKKGNKVGFTDVRVSGGELKEVRIVLEKEVGGWAGFGLVLEVVIFLLVIGGVVWYFVFGKKGGRRKTRAVEKELENKVLDLGGGVRFGKRAVDIIKTLSDREADVVWFVRKKGGYCSQAKIRGELKIPRTSLFRIIQSLKAKKVVMESEAGRTKKIEFTGWFLGRE